jgi:hypothetical protein
MTTQCSSPTWQKQRYFKRILTAAWLALLMDSFYPEVFVVFSQEFQGFDSSSKVDGHFLATPADGCYGIPNAAGATGRVARPVKYGGDNGKPWRGALFHRARRTMLGDDGNQIGAHSALRTLHFTLERLFSGIQFGMDDWGIWRLNVCQRINERFHQMPMSALRAKHRISIGRNGRDRSMSDV